MAKKNLEKKSSELGKVHKFTKKEMKEFNDYSEKVLIGLKPFFREREMALRPKSVPRLYNSSSYSLTYSPNKYEPFTNKFGQILSPIDYSRFD